MSLRLSYVITGDAQITVTLPNDSAPRIGRDPAANDILLHDPTVSRRHARLIRRESGWVVQDFGSRLGTFVDGFRVEVERPIKTGEVIEIGPYVLRVELDVPVEFEPVDHTEQIMVSDCPRCSAPVFSQMESCLSCGLAVDVSSPD